MLNFQNSCQLGAGGGEIMWKGEILERPTLYLNFFDYYVTYFLILNLYTYLFAQLTVVICPTSILLGVRCAPPPASYAYS
jgi:hypothetical protein